jgi:hypothetical protein
MGTPKRSLTYLQIVLIALGAGALSAVALALYLYINTADLIGSLQVAGPISLLIVLGAWLVMLVNRDNSQGAKR